MVDGQSFMVHLALKEWSTSWWPWCPLDQTTVSAEPHLGFSWRTSYTKTLMVQGTQNSVLVNWGGGFVLFVGASTIRGLQFRGSTRTPDCWRVLNIESLGFLH